MSSSRVPTGAFLLFIGVQWFPSIGSFWLFLGAFFLLKDISESNPLNPGDAVNSLAYIAVFSAASFWQRQVTEIVPEPYLDEVFHIPQAQAYCNGDYYVWDPKLTTPPGLYLFSTFFVQALGRVQCTVGNLRVFNTFALVATMVYACDCRRMVRQFWQRSTVVLDKAGSELSEVVSNIDLHTAINIALFPPLFFFSGLYYTDVLSTCLVVLAFKSFLQREAAHANSTLGSLWVFLIGLVALTMRQTNIFWVAVFLGGLQAVKSIKSTVKPVVKQSPHARTWHETIASSCQHYSRGHIHDISLSDAVPQDFALCATSLTIAILNHPLLILTRLWPYIALLLSFMTFITWNNGVVLGDKSNHVATLHLPQLLYLWPFITFFSWPLLLPSLLQFLSTSLSTALFLLTPSPVPRLPTLRRIALPILVSSIAVFIALVTIHFNTLIHPFTLADNRHYVFYVFRYTILRHPLIRYLLTPIYLLCFYLCYQTLCPALSGSSTSTTSSTLHRTVQQKRIVATARASAVSRRETDISASEGADNAGLTTSFFLIWFIATALSLVTAPLVEPRYFIIPWVMWRLHVPSSTASAASSQSPSRSTSPPQARAKKDLISAKRSAEGNPVEVIGTAASETSAREGYNARLMVETAWFLLVNAVTGYVFLYKGFEWKSEPGLVQRFMW